MRCQPAAPIIAPSRSRKVERLHQGRLVEVGAHTITHPILSALPSASQVHEIRRNKARLEKILDRSVSSFAYPYGKPYDYTAQTIEIVRQAGFTCACASFAWSSSGDPVIGFNCLAFMYETGMVTGWHNSLVGGLTAEQPSDSIDGRGVTDTMTRFSGAPDSVWSFSVPCYAVARRAPRDALLRTKG